MGRIRRKNLDDPDEFRQLERASLSIVTIGSHLVGLGVVQPGFRWSTHVGAAMGTRSCPIHHLQLVLSGRFGVRMDDGEEVELTTHDFFEVPPGHDAWVIGDEPVVLLDVAGNVGALGVAQEHDRVVTTLLMTDIVESTRLASQIGDAAWKQHLADHNRIVRVQLHRFRGVEVATTGDGFLATFDSAAGALRAADGIRHGVREAGVEVRIGVHTGEVERIGDDIGGVAVHAAARVMALGGPSEVLASSVTQGLADGSGLTFEDHGRHQVKGLDRPIDVVRLVG
jgi:class 3 adenylate cyclase